MRVEGLRGEGLGVFSWSLSSRAHRRIVFFVFKFYIKFRAQWLGFLFLIVPVSGIFAVRSSPLAPSAQGSGVLGCR